MNRRYRLIFSNPVSGMRADDFVKVHPRFTPNIPSNLLEETEIATKLEGVVSQDTQLGILSIIENVRDEVEKINAEKEKQQESIVETMMFQKTETNEEGDNLNE